jgi:hypothetical protein
VRSVLMLCLIACTRHRPAADARRRAAAPVLRRRALHAPGGDAQPRLAARRPRPQPRDRRGARLARRPGVCPLQLLALVRRRWGCRAPGGRRPRRRQPHRHPPADAVGRPRALEARQAARTRPPLPQRDRAVSAPAAPRRTHTCSSTDTSCGSRAARAARGSPTTRRRRPGAPRRRSRPNTLDRYGSRA